MSMNLGDSGGIVLAAIDVVRHRTANGVGIDLCSMLRHVDLEMSPQWSVIVSSDFEAATRRDDSQAYLEKC